MACNDCDRTHPWGDCEPQGVGPPWRKGDPRYRYKMADWTVADRLGDRMVDAMNTAIDEMRAADKMDSLQVMVGILLSLLSLERTLPSPDLWPMNLKRLMAQARLVLGEIQQVRANEERR